MNNVTKAKSLAYNGYTFEEIGRELGIEDVDVVSRYVKCRGYQQCGSCRRFFKHDDRMMYCGFLCWAGNQPNGFSYAQLKELYLLTNSK